MPNFEDSRGLESSFSNLAFAPNAFYSHPEMDKHTIGGNKPNTDSIAPFNGGIFSQPSFPLTSRSMNALPQASSRESNDRGGGDSGRGNFCWNYEQKDSNNGREDTTGTITANSIMDNSVNTKISDFNTTYGSSEQQENAESMQLELQLKETQIESLEVEIQSLKLIFNDGLRLRQEHDLRALSGPAINASVEVPASLEAIFQKLSSTLATKDKELDETKKRLESIVTAVALNPSNTVTKLGRYDEEALAHKMVVRLETLTKENQDMAKMLGYGRSKENHIEIELLKKENQELKKKLSQLERKAPKT